MTKYGFVVFALVAAAGLAGGAHTAAARGADGLPTATVAEKAHSESALAGPLDDSGWS
ncbi:hypothetical protein ACIPX0_27300 [Streptomyces sp. NPDC090075]|uniref:hypothetical protein n=1 Tax=unclassified Streptomyces TaxID=2593676 RepID=UPI00380B21CE